MGIQVGVRDVLAGVFNGCRKCSRDAAYLLHACVWQWVCDMGARPRPVPTALQQRLHVLYAVAPDGLDHAHQPHVPVGVVGEGLGGGGGGGGRNRAVGAVGAVGAVLAAAGGVRAMQATARGAVLSAGDGAMVVVVVLGLASFAAAAVHRHNAGAKATAPLCRSVWVLGVLQEEQPGGETMVCVIGAADMATRSLGRKR